MMKARYLKFLSLTTVTTFLYSIVYYDPSAIRFLRSISLWKAEDPQGATGWRVSAHSWSIVPRRGETCRGHACAHVRDKAIARDIRSRA